jgi:hypothetical protein
MLFGNLTGIVNGTEKVVFDYEVTGSAVSSVGITGLNGDVDQWYTILIRTVSTTGGNNIGLRINGDTGSNYGRRNINAASTTISDASGALSYHYVCGESSGSNFSVIRLYAKSGAVRMLTSLDAEAITTTTVLSCSVKACVWNNSVDNITSLTLTSSAGNTSIGVGTRIIILKSNLTSTGTPCGSITTPYIQGSWARVGSSVLGASATTVDFTVDGNRDVIYCVSVGYKNAYSGSGYVYVRFNSDGGTNYGYQLQSAESTTTSAARGTATENYITAASAVNEYGQGQIIIFAKSGFIRPNVSIATPKWVSGTTVGQHTFYGQTWNNTSDNIITLTVGTNRSNGLATGTRIDVYALRPNG